MSRANRRAALLVGALALLGAVATAAPDDFDLDRWISEWTDHLSNGRYPEAERIRSPQVTPLLVAAPEKAHEVARAAARYIHGGTRKGDQASAGLSDWLADVGAKAVETAPESPAAKRALAAGLATRAHFQAAVGTATTMEDWNGVARHTLASYDHPGSADKGRACAEAAGWIRGAVGWEGLSDAELLAHLDTLAAKAATLGGGEHATLAKAEADLARAKASVGKKGGDAAAAVQRCLAALDPLVTGDRSTLAANAHAGAVTLARTHKLGKAAYKTVRKEAASVLRYAYPLCDWWKPYREEQPGQTIAAASQLGPHREPRRRVLLLQFDSSKTWSPSDGGKAVDGGNVKGMTEMQMGILRKNFESVSREKGPFKAQPCKALPAATGFELEGTRQDGTPMRIRAWYFRAKESPNVLGIQIFDFALEDTTDPELESFLESLSEIKKK